MGRLQPAKAASPTYRQIWRIVDGAVDLALTAHPEFLASSVSPKTVRNSIVKRVTGAINGYAEQSAWVRSGFSPADAETDPALHGSVAVEAACHFDGRVANRGAGRPAGEAVECFSRHLGEGQP